MCEYDSSDSSGSDFEEENLDPGIPISDVNHVELLPLNQNFIINSRFHHISENLFNSVCLYFSSMEIGLLIEKYLQYDEKLYQENMNFWTLLWIRDINNKPPGENIRSSYIDTINMINRWIIVKEELNNRHFKIMYKCKDIIKYKALKQLILFLDQYKSFLNSIEWWELYEMALYYYPDPDIAIYLIDNIEEFNKLSSNKLELNKLLLISCRRGNLQIIKYLISSGADPTYKSKHGNINAIYELCSSFENDSNLIEAVDYFIGLNCNMNNIVQVYFNTFFPIERAIYRDHYNIARLLAERGADLSINNYQILNSLSRGKNETMNERKETLNFLLGKIKDKSVIPEETRRLLGI